MLTRVWRDQVAIYRESVQKIAVLVGFYLQMARIAIDVNQVAPNECELPRRLVEVRAV